MTDTERTAIDAWFSAVQAAQPQNTLALLVYVCDGQVFLGRGDVQIEMKGFDPANLPHVSELVSEALEVAYHTSLNTTPPQP
jgi:hypothetical protein